MVIYPSLEYDQYQEAVVKDLSRPMTKDEEKEGFIPSSTRIIEINR